MPLSGTNLTFAYPKGPPVLRDVDCLIHPASITAIVGPNGAGKSTLLKLLAAVNEPQSGTISLDGSPVGSLTATRRAARIAYIAQRSALAFDFDVRKVVSFGRLALPKDPEAIDRAIHRFDLTNLQSTPMGTLSVGQQQRVSLARAWAQLDSTSTPEQSGTNQHTNYLFADEPTSAMDPKHQLHTLSALKDLADSGVGIGLVAHDLSLALQYSDQAILLDDSGRVHSAGPASEVLTTDALGEVFDARFIQGTVEGQAVLIPATPSVSS